MKHRVVIWAAGGCLISACWAIYLFIRTPLTSAETIVYALARFTQPVVLAGSYFHFGLRVYWSF